MIDTHWMEGSKPIEVNPNDVTSALCDIRDVRAALPERILHSRIDDESDYTVNDAIKTITDFLEDLERQWK